MNIQGTEHIYGVGAEFAGPAELYAAAEKVRDKGYSDWDVFSPFPIHGMDRAMGLGKSWLSSMSLLGALAGFFTAVVLQYAVGWVYPLVVQGKETWTSTPAYVPVMFELSVLLCAFGTVAGILVFNLLPRLNHPLFNWEAFTKVTDDGFFLVIESDDPLFQTKAVTEFLRGIGGTNVTVIPKS